MLAGNSEEYVGLVSSVRKIKEAVENFESINLLNLAKRGNLD